MDKFGSGVACSDMVDVSQCLVQQTLYVIVIEAVKGLASASAAGHQAKIAQDAEVLRNRRLCHLDG